jgi:hypothetical protein
MVVTLGILAAAAIEGLLVHGACGLRGVEGLALRIFAFNVPSRFFHDCSSTVVGETDH